MSLTKFVEEHDGPCFRQHHRSMICCLLVLHPNPVNLRRFDSGLLEKDDMSFFLKRSYDILCITMDDFGFWRFLGGGRMYNMRQAY